MITELVKCCLNMGRFSQNVLVVINYQLWHSSKQLSEYYNNFVQIMNQQPLLVIEVCFNWWHCTGQSTHVLLYCNLILMKSPSSLSNHPPQLSVAHSATITEFSCVSLVSLTTGSVRNLFLTLPVVKDTTFQAREQLPSI